MPHISADPLPGYQGRSLHAGRRPFLPACPHSSSASSRAGRLAAPQASRRELLLSTVPVGLSLAAGGALAAPLPEAPFCGVVERVPSWAYSTPWQESLIDYAGGHTWYRYVNFVKPAGLNPLDALAQRYSAVDQAKAPIVVIGGGPGLPCSYLYSLELMAGVGRRVVFYDQVGVGTTFLASNETCPPPDQLTLELYLGQLQALVQGLQLPAVHLYGQGPWGAALALEYAARNPAARSSTSSYSGASSSSSSSSSESSSKGVLSVACTSCGASYQQVIKDRVAAAGALGEPYAGLLLQQPPSSSSSRSSKEQRAAWRGYIQRYIQRTDTGSSRGSAVAACVANALSSRSLPVYQALAGGQAFAEAGRLAGWSVEPLVGQLQELPVLVARGEYDEVTDATAQQLASALPQGQLVTVKGSGSYMHIDQWEEHLLQLENHLCAAEGSPPPTAA